MAEIKVEKKKPIWPWIILIVIIILGILWYVFVYGDANDEVEGTDDIEELNDTSVFHFMEKGETTFSEKTEIIS